MRKITYIFDAYCGWCYGFSKAINELATDPDIEVRVVHGSLFGGENRVRLGDFPHIPGANAQIAQLTGAVFGEPYQALLADGSMVMNSDDAARGLAALKLVGGEERGLEFATAMQRAFYLQGKSLSEAESYADIAEELGLSAQAVQSAFASEDAAALARKDQEWIANLGVQSYPTPLLETPSGFGIIGTATSTAAQMREVIAKN